METLRKAGMEGYDPPSQGRGLDLPIPAEGSKQRAQVERVISQQMPAIPTGRMVTYLNPDEEKLLVDIIELRDFYGFGLDRDDIMATAQRWCEAGGLFGASCGRHWFRGFMARAKRYKADFGESKR